MTNYTYAEVKDEANTGEEPQDDGSTNEEDYEDEVVAADATTNPGDNPPSSSCAPPEPEGPPPTLSLRQKRRLQQLLQEGELQRRTAEETDEMLWKRFRGQQKEEYRGYRKAQRRRGEWLPDRWRGDGRRGKWKMAKVRGASEGNRGPSLRRLPLHMPFENNSSEPFFFPDTCFAGGGISRMYSPLFQWGLDLCLSHTRGCNIRRAAGADLHT